MLVFAGTALPGSHCCQPGTRPPVAVMERIEAATKIIGELIMEVSRDIFVSEAADEITGEASID